MEDLTIPKLLEEFLAVYPEFAPLYTTQEQIDRFELIIGKLKCIYPQYKNIEGCNSRYPFFMLLAHTLVMNGETKSIGILASSGIKSNSSIGDVSVGFQATPYDKDNFSYWLALSPYGREYLAWLQTQVGMLYIN